MIPEPTTAAARSAEPTLSATERRMRDAALTPLNSAELARLLKHSAVLEPDRG